VKSNGPKGESEAIPTFFGARRGSREKALVTEGKVERTSKGDSPPLHAPVLLRGGRGASLPGGGGTASYLIGIMLAKVVIGKELTKREEGKEWANVSSSQFLAGDGKNRGNFGKGLQKKRGETKLGGVSKSPSSPTEHQKKEKEKNSRFVLDQETEKEKEGKRRDRGE